MIFSRRGWLRVGWGLRGGQRRCGLLPGEIADGQNVENLPPAANVGGGGEEGDDEDHGVEQVLALLHVALCGAGVVVVEVQELGRAECKNRTRPPMDPMA